MLHCIPKLLRSSSARIRSWTCEILAELTQTWAAAVLGVKPCKQLVSLLRDENLVVVESALYALSLLINWPEGAQDALDANLLGSIGKLAISASSDVQARTCLLLGQLAAQDTTSASVLGGIGKPLVQILQRDSDLEAELDFQAYSWIGSPIL
ncbi:hypothetical protein DFH09DRAFT_1289123 [Mycena vulgaris]|nr:hypothetical protein DFH09DRAFT_1289123 [Mycena vulgaris]